MCGSPGFPEDIPLWSFFGLLSSEKHLPAYSSGTRRHPLRYALPASDIRSVLPGLPLPGSVHPGSALQDDPDPEIFPETGCRLPRSPESPGRKESAQKSDLRPVFPVR